MQDFWGVVCSAPISILAEQLEAATHNSSTVGRATKKDIADLPMAEKYYRSRAIGDFVSISDEQRTVKGYSLSVVGQVVKKVSVKEGRIWHHTLYVEP